MATSRLGKDAILVPIGTTAERPTNPERGQIRYNTDEESFEGYNGSEWAQVGGGAVEDLFYENARTVDEDYVVSSTRNTMTIGPITVADGIAITVPSDARWVII